MLARVTPIADLRLEIQHDATWQSIPNGSCSHFSAPVFRLLVPLGVDVLVAARFCVMPAVLRVTMHAVCIMM